MEKKQFWILRMDVAAWALMILSNVVQGHAWQIAYAALSVVAAVAGNFGERESGSRGFWGKVWDR